MNESIAIGNVTAIPFVATIDGGDTMAKVDADGTCTIDWNLVESKAAKWNPFCGDAVAAVADLLLAARETRP